MVGNREKEKWKNTIKSGQQRGDNFSKGLILGQQQQQQNINYNNKKQTK